MIVLDWRSPWLAPLAAIGRPIADRIAAGSSVADALNTTTAPRRFVRQTELPAGEAYEAFIARSGCVPTRDSLHDFFNGLLWHHEPQLKARLNTWQAAEIRQRGIGPTRGALRDALTLFDEHGAWLEAPAELLQALVQRQWTLLFVEQRGLWRQARLKLFGHALLEQLCTAPRKGLTAHVWIGEPCDRPAPWAAKPFVPLPVLGIPGWWPANQDPGFYRDPAVFRLKAAAAP